MTAKTSAKATIGKLEGRRGYVLGMAPRDRLERVTSLLAGTVVQWKGVPRSAQGRSDFRTVDGILGHGLAADRAWHECWRRAERLCDMHWSQIERLAHALLRYYRLTGKEVPTIVYG